MYMPAPFSVRNRRGVAPIDEDFPASARIGLVHILDKATGKDFVASWEAVANELQRIARLPRTSVGEVAATNILNQLRWDQVYDFCERVYSDLAQKGNIVRDNYIIRHTKADAQVFIADELQRLFDEENLAYEFRDGIVQRRGRRHTVDQVASADEALSKAGLDAARQHFEKAQRYFHDRNNPDFENAVKEAVCAVEDAAKDAAKNLFPDANGATLGDVVKWLTGPEPGKLPKTIAQTLTGLYGFRNSGDGVGHGGSTGGAVTPEIAEYVLAIAASQIILLVDLAPKEPDEELPF